MATLQHCTFLFPTTMTSSTLPDYYAFLNIPQTATAEEVRIAYRRESLKYAASIELCVCLAHLGSTLGHTLTDS